MAPITLDPQRLTHGVLMKFPRSSLATASCFAAFGLLIIAPLTLAIFQLCGLQSLEATELAMVMVGPMIVVSLREGD